MYNNKQYKTFGKANHTSIIWNMRQIKKITFSCIVAIAICNTVLVLAQKEQDDLKYISGELFIKIAANCQLPNSGIHAVLDNVQPNDAFNFLTHYLIKNNQQYQVLEIKSAFPRLDSPNLNRIYRIVFANTAHTSQLINCIKAIPCIEYVERVPLHNTLYTPNDLNSNQWHLEKIMAENAWDIHLSSNNVTVAIVDDGILTTHEDLADNIVNGFDVSDNDANAAPPIGASSNCFSHGTHCAGIVAAVNNNNIGIASLAGHVRIMPIKTKPDAHLDNNCNSLPQTIAGIEYAIASHVDIISMSFGGYASSNAVQELFNQAYAQGIVCVAAAGNDNTSNALYPASYEHVISVGASNENDQKATFSNYGTTIDVMAPGTSIYSTIASNNVAYGTKQGTSMACPLVASLCALMLSYQPNLTPDDLESCLKSSCDNIDALNPTFIGQLGVGRINAYQTLNCLLPEPTAQFTYTPNTPCIGQSVQFNDISNGMAVSQRLWTFEGGTPATATTANPIVTFADNGAHSVTLNVTNAAGSNSITKTVNVQATTAIISGNSILELGNSAVLTIALSGTPPFAITYTDGTTPITIPNINNISYELTVSPTMTTTYSLLSVNGSGNCSGTTSGSATITVVPVGSGTIPPIAINPVGTVCRYELPFNIAATPIGGVFSGNGISDPLNGTFNPSIAGVGTHTIIYTYHDASGDTYSATSNVTVTGENVNAGNNRVICPGESIQLQATGGSNYQWSPLINIEQESTATPIVYPMSSTTYTVVSTDIHGCQSSDAVTIALNPAPYFPIPNIDTTLCAKNSIDIQFTDLQAVANYSYIWFPSIGVEDPHIPNSVIHVNESTAYSLIISNENACQTVRNFTVNLKKPNAQIRLSTPTLCQQEQVVLTAQGNDIVQYAWSSGSSDSTITTNTAATYSVTLTDSAGCTDTDSANIVESNINIPRIQGTIIAADATTTTLSTTEAYSYYSWSNGSEEAQITVGTGIYSVTVSNESGCSATTSAIVRPFDKYAAALPTAFSPNGDGLNDEWQITTSDNAAVVQYAVYNRWGQLVFNSTEENVPIWNGKKKGVPCEQGTYIVVGNIAFDDGSSKAIKGMLTLLR